MLLSACFEEEEKPLAAETSPASSGIVQVEPEAPWLEMNDPEAPLAFLARHSGASEAELAPDLAAAALRYRESERMIANRLLALWLETGGVSGEEPGFIALLRDFTRGEGAGAEQSIGPVIQNYRMLRGQGLGHEAALARAMRGKDDP